MQFTDDEYVKHTFPVPHDAEIAHIPVFSAALDTIQPNFPLGMSTALRVIPTRTSIRRMEPTRAADGTKARALGDGGHWEYVYEPHKHVIDTQGETKSGALATPAKG